MESGAAISSHGHDGDKRVRPDGGKPPGAPASSRGGLVTVLVGLAGLVLGYLLGISGSTGASGEPVAVGAAPGPSTTVPGLTEAPAAGTAPDPAPTTSTVTTTTGAPEALPILRDIVPSLSGKRLFGLGDGRAFLWRNGSSQPQTLQVPMDAYVKWNEQGTLLAYVERPGHDPPRARLWLSRNGQAAEPVWVGASAFAWHATEPKIAWLGVTPGADTWQLMWAEVRPTGLDDISVLDLDLPIDLQVGWVWLHAYGDFGWVVTHEQWAEQTYSTEVLAITPDLEVRRRAGIDQWVVTVSPDGRILLGGSGLEHNQVWTDMAFAEGERITGAAIYDVEWAFESGDMLAVRDDGTPVYVLSTAGDGGFTNIPLPIGGYSPALSPDGALALGIVAQGSFQTEVRLFVAGEDEVVELEIPGSWWFVDVAGA